MDTHTIKQRVVFLGRLARKDPDVHAMLRRSKGAQPTPLAQPVWDAYLQTHFRPTKAVQVGCGSVEVSARDMAVPLGRGRDVEALLRQSAQNQWMPVPDVAVTPSESVKQMLVAEQIKKMNGCASPGIDRVAVPLIKHAVVIRPRADQP